MNSYAFRLIKCLLLIQKINRWYVSYICKKEMTRVIFNVCIHSQDSLQTFYRTLKAHKKVTYADFFK